jgi:hypothetical protein
MTARWRVRLRHTLDVDIQTFILLRKYFHADNSSGVPVDARALDNAVHWV